ncbi:MAG: hypothetical protein ACNYVW_03015 [Methanosarcinales archaeon]
MIDKRRIINVIGHLDDYYLEAIARALHIILGL